MRNTLAVLLLASVALLTGCGKMGGAGATGNPASSNIDAQKYYAVLLANGSVYFGHLEGLTSDFPVLKDVYYVQSSKNPQTNEVNNVLVKRGKEWHGPDRMIINQKAIVFIEPVGLDSVVAKRIEDSRR